LSSRSSMYRRLMTMAGATALTVGGLGAVLATGGTAFASDPASSPYSIGYTVSGVTFASTSSVSNASANYTLGFVMPSNVDTSTTTLTLSGLPDASLPGTAIVTDTTAGTTQVLAINSSGVITLSGAVAGDNYTVVLDGATNASGTTSTSYSPEIEVGSSDFGTAASFTLTPTSTAAAATASASTSTSGASATDTFSGFAVTNGTGTTTTAPYELYLDFSAASQTYPTAPSDYAVQVTSNGHTTSDTVDSVTGLATGSTSGEYLTLTLASAIPTSATVAVTIDGAINNTGPTTNGFLPVFHATSSPRCGGSWTSTTSTVYFFL